jgi:hypothetical protein
MGDIIPSPGKATGFLLFIECCLVCFTGKTSAGAVLIRDQQLTIHAKNTPLREIHICRSEIVPVVICGILTFLVIGITKLEVLWRY